MTTPNQQAQKREPQRREKVGRVVSNKMNKTIVVEVETLKRHPLYGRTLRRHKKFKAHDEFNHCNMGDMVRIVECRPISKDKHFRVVEILGKRDEVEAIQPEAALSEIEVVLDE
jgi:small subunit ribosomal protein S17